jgi:biopolymer transport protein ExbB
VKLQGHEVVLMDKRFTRLTGIALLAFGAAEALAQDAAGAGTKSLWSIFWAGLHWPAFFILAGSVAMIALIVEHFITIRRVNIAPPEQIRRAKQLIELRKFRECYDTCNRSHTMFAVVMSAALLHARHGFEAMHEAAVEKAAQISGRMFRKVEYMNILGNLGPLMGLLGTVLGMIVSFANLGVSADGSQLAEGISIALVNTLLGLALAIVGLGFYGWCRNRIDGLSVEATVAVLDLLEYFRPVPVGGQRPAAETEVRAPAAAPEPRPIIPAAGAAVRP